MAALLDLRFPVSDGDCVIELRDDGDGLINVLVFVDEFLVTRLECMGRDCAVGALRGLRGAVDTAIPRLMDEALNDDMEGDDDE